MIMVLQTLDPGPLTGMHKTGKYSRSLQMVHEIPLKLFGVPRHYPVGVLTKDFHLPPVTVTHLQGGETGAPRMIQSVNGIPHFSGNIRYSNINTLSSHH